MPRNKKNHEIFFKIFKIFVIVDVIMLFGSSLYMNYDANKRFDDLWYFHNEMTNIYKGFQFSDQAEQEHIFYWKWSCVITKDQEYWDCYHCPIIPFTGECQHHVFELYDLSHDEIDLKMYLQDQRDHAQSTIFWLSVLLGALCLGYWFWQKKYDHENWSRTPLSKLYNKIKEVDDDGNKNR